MSKSVVLVLEPSHESEYGEYSNIAVFNAHGDIIGWVGGEVPESGHPCEFNILDEEGFTACASSTTVNRLRAENERLRSCLSDDAENERLIMGEYKQLREENERLRTMAVRYYTELLHSDDALGQIMSRKKLQELGIEV